jgi:hypothetical protein
MKIGENLVNHTLDDTLVFFLIDQRLDFSYVLDHLFALNLILSKGDACCANGTVERGGLLAG